MLLEICLVMGIILAFTDFLTTRYKFQDIETDELSPIAKRVMRKIGASKTIVSFCVMQVCLYIVAYTLGTVFELAVIGQFLLFPIVAQVISQINNLMIVYQLRKE